MPSHPHANPLPSSLNATSGTPLKNKASSHHTQTYSDAEPASVVWQVNHGFREVLRRGIGQSLMKTKLEESLFPDEILKDAFPGKEFTLESVVDRLARIPNTPNLPDSDKREVQWANYLNAISDVVEQLTLTEAKRRWVAVYADKPVPNSKMLRKPDIALIPLDLQKVWRGKEFIRDSEVHWSMLCSTGEEKGKDEARTSKAEYSLDNVSGIYGFYPCPDILTLDSAAQQIMDRAYFMFGSQPNRRFILNLSIAGTQMRLTQFNRAHILHGDYFDAELVPNYRRLLRIVIGLMFCTNEDVGYDPTITVKMSATEDPVYYVTAGEKKYRIAKTLFRSDYICGRGTIVWRAVPADCVDLEDESQWVTIKDVWADASRVHMEDWFLRRARDAGITEGVPELLWGGVVPFGRAGDATDRHSSRVDQPTPVPVEHEQPVDQTRPKVPKVNRAHRRLVFKNCGIPITQFRTKKELLEVLIELIQSTCSCGEMTDLSNSRSSLVHDRLVKNMACCIAISASRT